MTEPTDSTPPDDQPAVADADKPKSKSVPRPDRKAVEKAAQAIEGEITVINTEIEGYDKQLEEIKKQIDQANEMRSGQQDELTKAREQRDEIKAELDAVKKERDDLQMQLEEVKSKVDSAVESSKSAKATMRFRTAGEIDAEIARLNREQSTVSMSLAEEKKIVKEIEQLKAQKRQLVSLGQSQEQISRDRDERTRLSNAPKEKRDEFTAVLTRLNEQRALCDSLQKPDEKKGKIAGLLEERKAVQERKKEALKRINDIRAKRNELWEEFKAKKKEWEVFMDEERKQREAEKKARYEEYLKKLEEEELKKVPYEQEMVLCDELVKYLQTTFLVEGEQGSEEAKGSSSSSNGGGAAAGAGVLQLDGGVLLAAHKREDEDDDPSSRKKGKGAGGKKGKTKPRDNAIVHAPDTIASFALVQVDAPNRISAVAGAIVALKEKKEWYSVQPRPPPKSKSAATEEAEGGDTKADKAAPKKGKAKEFKRSESDFPSLGGPAAEVSKSALVNGSGSEEEVAVPLDPADS